MTTPQGVLENLNEITYFMGIERLLDLILAAETRENVFCFHAPSMNWNLNIYLPNELVIMFLCYPTVARG